MMRFNLLLFLAWGVFGLVVGQTIDEQTSAWLTDIFGSNAASNNDNKSEDTELDLDPLSVKQNRQPSGNTGQSGQVSNKFDSVSPKPSADTPMPCMTDKQERGYCVLYYQCDPDSRTLIVDGATLIDVRSGACPNYLHVCCLRTKILDSENQATEVENPQPTGPVTHPPTPPKRPDQKKTQPETIIESPKVCGWSHPSVNVFKESNGIQTENEKYANFGEFPWMVAVLKKQQNTDVWSQNDYIGGASIIHPSVVITAAHKIDKFETTAIKCRGGEYDTQTTLEQYPFQERDVSKITIHPEYFRTSAYNDVALLRLQRPFDLNGSPHMGLACLGRSLPAPGTTCFSMGWGKEFNEPKKYAVVLKKVKLDLVEHDECQKLLQAKRLGSYFRLHESLTCAGGEEGVDTCRGDGGSSLVCSVGESNGNRRYAVYGMVAYGLSCGKRNVPGVYVNVPHIYNWVNEEMNKERLDIAYNY